MQTLINNWICQFYLYVILIGVSYMALDSRKWIDSILLFSGFFFYVAQYSEAMIAQFAVCTGTASMDGSSNPYNESEFSVKP